MAQEQNLGGVFTLPGTDKTLHRMGYGAMRLSGPQIFGPPKDRPEAIAVLRGAVEAGVNHIDTSDFYGPHVVNQIICEALHPYPKNLVLVTKVGAVRGDDASWNPANSPAELVEQVHDNLRNLKVDALDVVNFRVWGRESRSEGPVAEQFSALAELQQKGLIRHLGISHATETQIAEARSIAPVVCVQNMYNVAHREDTALIEQLDRDGIAYVPYFPLGGFSPLQSSALDAVAADLNAIPMQVALAWLLQHAPNILLIPGTSTVAHLRENLAAAELTLPPEAVTKLDAIGNSGSAA